ncbi:hypothetical protein RM704_07025 [Streptomyces sp. DSM 3412]|uniref:Uncharacterized protein n=1 Tax=Streptomyces gottesmaniae TaxID=3075518 RepID=A0ABU2YSC2_9ACTN|nr:hypothetical protein [Streptomyces sp. DSM 3412]MDT0567215.1 hypothetical protein [Streptomyces sp. DSM 3412]
MSPPLAAEYAAGIVDVVRAQLRRRHPGEKDQLDGEAATPRLASTAPLCVLGQLLTGSSGKA